MLFHTSCRPWRLHVVVTRGGYTWWLHVVRGAVPHLMPTVEGAALGTSSTSTSAGAPPADAGGAVGAAAATTADADSEMTDSTPAVGPTAEASASRAAACDTAGTGTGSQCGEREVGGDRWRSREVAPRA